MQKTYKFKSQPVDVTTILCDDGDVILEIGNFPSRFTVYLDRDGVRGLIRQLEQTTSQKEPA